MSHTTADLIQKIERLISERNEAQRKANALNARLVAMMHERDEANAALTSLSALVMEREPAKWRAWLDEQTPGERELARERAEEQEEKAR